MTGCAAQPAGSLRNERVGPSLGAPNLLPRLGAYQTHHDCLIFFIERMLRIHCPQL